MKLPKSVKVGPYTFEIVETADLGGREIGHCDKNNLRICIDPNLPDDKKKNTLIHEILHAIYEVWAIDDDSKEEPVVNALASGLQTVFKDNPKLLVILK